MPYGPNDINSAVSQALLSPAAAIPAGHTGALVAIVGLQGASLAIAHKISNNWQVDGMVEHPWVENGLAAGISIHGSW